MRTSSGHLVGTSRLKCRNCGERHPGTACLSTTVDCDYCGRKHRAEPAHVSPTQGQIWAVVCDDVPVYERVIDYYTEERVS